MENGTWYFIVQFLNMRKKEYSYFVFLKCALARRLSQFNCEWYENGEWVENQRRTLSLEDSLMDYGDWSVGDNDQITPELAEELIQKGTIVLHGNIGYGCTYCEPKTIILGERK